MVSGPNVVADQNGDGDTDYSITINLCIGCGTAGVDATQDFWFTFTGAGSVISVSPTTIDFGGDVANGSISGQTVFFDVCNTNSCDICANGNNNQVCTNITFIVDDYPSNLTVYGLEEQCDGMGGCNSGGDYCVNDYPNTDNTPETITFTLPLTLNFFRAKEVGKTNVIELNILTASNIKNLVLQKLVKVENSGEHTHGEKESGFHFDMWKTLSVTPVPDGNIDGKTMTFVDENPTPVNYYRVLYEEFDGVINTTPVVYVGNKSVEQSLLNVLPNPVLPASLKDDTARMNDRNKHKVTGQMNHQTADPKAYASVFLFFPTAHF